MIYLDNAATTLIKPDSVAAAVLDSFGHLGNAGRGVNDASLDASRSLYAARETAASLFNAARPQQIAFTANVTEALNMAVQGLVRPSDRIVTTAADHNSVLRPCYLMREKGAELAIVPVDAQGRLDWQAFDDLVTPGTRMVVCTHASNVTGNIYDIGRIAQLAHSRGALFVLDAAQTAGHESIDVQALGLDVLCFTGHKGLYGPQGTGGLYVRPELEIQPLLAGGTGVQSYNPHQPPEMPTVLEAGTLNGPGIAGLQAGMRFVLETGPAAIGRRTERLAERFLAGLRRLRNITLYGDFSGRRTAVVSLNLGHYDAAAVSDALYADYGIATRAGAHCAPLMHEALGTKERGTVRFSFSWFNTEAEVDAAVQALADLGA